MVGKKEIFVILFVFVFLIGMASAIDTEIKVKTLPEHKISVFVYESGALPLLESKHALSDSNGFFSYIHTSEKSKIDVMVKITKDGKEVFPMKKFPDYSAGSPIFIRIDNEEVSGQYNPDAEKVQENNSAVLEPVNSSDAVNSTINESVVSESNEAITGAAISEGSNNDRSSLLYYLLGGILIVGVIAFFAIKRLSMESYPASGQSQPLRKVVTSEQQASINSFNKEASPISSLPNEELEIERVEQRIKDAQQELNLIKNKERIKVAEAKLEADRRELERLKGSS